MALTVHENAGMIVEMTADATLQGTAILKQEESLIGEALEDVPELTGKKDGSGKCISCKQGVNYRMAILRHRNRVATGF